MLQVPQTQSDINPSATNVTVVPRGERAAWNSLGEHIPRRALDASLKDRADLSRVDVLRVPSAPTLAFGSRVFPVLAQVYPARWFTL